MRRISYEQKVSIFNQLVIHRCHKAETPFKNGIVPAQAEAAQSHPKLDLGAGQSFIARGLKKLAY